MAEKIPEEGFLEKLEFALLGFYVRDFVQDSSRLVIAKDESAVSSDGNPNHMVRCGLIEIQLNRSSGAGERNLTSRVLDRRQRRGVPSARLSADRRLGLASATPWVLTGNVEVLARSLRGRCDAELLHPRAKRARIDAQELCGAISPVNASLGECKHASNVAGHDLVERGYCLGWLER